MSSAKARKQRKNSFASSLVACTWRASILRKLAHLHGDSCSNLGSSSLTSSCSSSNISTSKFKPSSETSIPFRHVAFLAKQAQAAAEPVAFQQETVLNSFVADCAANEGSVRDAEPMISIEGSNLNAAACLHALELPTPSNNGTEGGTVKHQRPILHNDAGDESSCYETKFQPALAHQSHGLRILADRIQHPEQHHHDNSDRQIRNPNLVGFVPSRSSRYLPPSVPLFNSDPSLGSSASLRFFPLRKGHGLTAFPESASQNELVARSTQHLPEQSFQFDKA